MKSSPKAKQLRVRADPVERDAFERAAHMAGLTLSAWLRMACREVATRQFTNAGEKAPWTK